MSCLKSRFSAIVTFILAFAIMGENTCGPHPTLQEVEVVNWLGWLHSVIEWMDEIPHSEYN